MSKIDDALRRYRGMRAILEKESRTMLARPGDRLHVDLGLVEAGLTSGEARRRLAEFYDDLFLKIEEMGFFDLVSTFEFIVCERIGNAIGESRDLLRSQYPQDRKLRGVVSRLVKEKREFESLAAIERLLEGSISRQLQVKMAVIRRERNRLAHGNSVAQPLALTVEQAHEVLATILDEIL